jgi:multidrug efflux system membrane fusion protein
MRRRSPEPSARRVLTLAVLSACVFAYGCSTSPARRQQRVPVAVAQAEKRTVPWEWEATGTVEPVASADVTAQVGGRVTRVAFREGDEVREGEPLVQLDPREFEANVAQASAELARDRAQARTARLEAERSEALARQQLLSTSELEDKQNAAEALAATVLADSAALARARLDLAYATVRAPIAGRTGRLHVHVGDVVKPNDPAAPVVTIHQLRPIRVRFTIPQADLDALRREREQDVRVFVADGVEDTTWSNGRLTFVDNQVDAATGTVLLKGEFPNRDGALWPGEFVRVRVQLRDESGATVVPAAAVSNSQQGAFCYVVKADTTVEMRPVQVSRTWRGLAVISSGVTPGETVVTDGQMRLAPGARASIRNAAATGGGGGSAAEAAR